MSETDELIPLVPKWTIGVFTQSVSHYADLKNALLYADEVEWLPLEAALFTMFNKVVEMQSELLPLIARASDENRFHFAQARSELEDLRSSHAQLQINNDQFESELHKSGLRPVVRASFDFDLAKRMLNEAWEYTTPSALREYGRMHPEVDARLLKEVDGPTFFFFRVIRIMEEIAARNTVCVNPGGLNKPVWNARARANLLMNTMSRLMLPDVGALPLEIIGELRDRLKQTLNPMRSEMLRFATDLRKAASSSNAHDLFEEADELITTRVEPIVREVGARAEELSRSKWRKFYVGLAKTFGFVGAGLFNPALLTNALEEVLSTGASVAEIKHPTETGATASFIIEARRLIAEHGR